MQGTNDKSKEYLSKKLVYAVCNSSLDNVKKLIQDGADANVKVDENLSLLHVAVLIGNCEIAELLSNKIDVDTKATIKRDYFLSQEEFLTPSHLSIHMPCPKLGLKCIQKGIAFTNDLVKCNGWTPLHCAIQLNNFNIVSALLDANADVGCKAESGIVPLQLIHNRMMMLLIFRHPRFVNKLTDLFTYLLQQGVDFNARIEPAPYSLFILTKMFLFYDAATCILSLNHTKLQKEPVSVS